MTLRPILRTLLGAAAFVALFAAGDAAAQSATFQVTATVARACSIEATPVAFGAYDPNAATPTDATGTITVQCTRGESYRVSLNDGLYAAGRQMQNQSDATEFLAYELYSDAGRTTAWTAGTSTVAASRAPVTLTVYGRIAANVDATVGTYTDTVTATINL